MIVVLSSREFELSSLSVQFCPMLAGYAGFTQSDRVEIEGDDQLMMELIKFLQGNDFNMSEEVMEFFEYAGFPNTYGYPLDIFKLFIRDGLFRYMCCKDDSFNDGIVCCDGLQEFRSNEGNILDSYYRLNCLTPFFSSGDIVIAGGSCLGYLTGTHFHDVDIFLIGSGDKINQVVSALKRRHQVYALTDNAVTFCDGGLMIRVIFRVFKNKAELLRSFDLECCQVLFDGRSFYMTEYCLNSVRTKEILCNPSLLSDRYSQRVVKYCLRGFKVQCPGFNEDIQFNPTATVRSFIGGDLLDEPDIIDSSYVDTDGIKCRSHYRVTPLVSEDNHIKDYIDMMTHRLEVLSGLNLQDMKTNRQYLGKLCALLVRSSNRCGLTHHDIMSTTYEQLKMILVRFMACCFKNCWLLRYDPESIVMLASKGIYVRRPYHNEEYDFIRTDNDHTTLQNVTIGGKPIHLYRSLSESVDQKNGSEVAFQEYKESCLTDYARSPSVCNESTEEQDMIWVIMRHTSSGLVHTQSSADTLIAHRVHRSVLKLSREVSIGVMKLIPDTYGIAPDSILREDLWTQIDESINIVTDQVFREMRQAGYSQTNSEEVRSRIITCHTMVNVN